ncbi:MAG: hypothetical protein JXR37_06800 [Kiritimatiellae bacterium]|nr:hypothetical protein [Kiritimatiellia bacterium]
MTRTPAKPFSLRVFDALSFILFAVTLLFALTGGGSFTVNGTRVTLDSVDIPAAALLLVLVIRVLLSRRAPLDELPVLRCIQRALRLVRRALGTPSVRHVWAFMAAYGLLMGAVVLRRHAAFQSHAFDLGIFDQV